MRVWRRRFRLLVLGGIGLLPSVLKRPLYRILFGYRIAPGVRIGISLLDAERVDLAEGTTVGHFNLFLGVGELVTGPRARVGFLNVVRGGERVTLGAYATVMRLNVLNAIPDHDCTTAPRSVLEIADGATLVSGHRVDFTDAVRIGRNSILGGRGSSLWTHSRQETAPISIGDFCYLGSEVRLAPGATMPQECILALGGVLTEAVTEPRSLLGGVPARVIRRLEEGDLRFIHRKTRNDMPDDWYSR